MQLIQQPDADNLVDHFAAHPWQANEHRYAWHLTWEHEPALHEVAAALQADLLDFPTLRLIPQRWLHLTLGHIGTEADVPPSCLAAERDRVASAITDLRLALSFREVHLMNEGVALVAEKTSELLRLGELVQPGRERPLWPHVSLAYSTAQMPAANVLAALGDDLPQDIWASHPTLTLMRLTRETGQYTWEALAQFPVGTDQV